MTDLPFVSEIEGRQPVSAADRSRLGSFVVENFGRPLPEDYDAFLRWSNGGIVKGPHLHVALDAAAEVPSTTADYGALEFISGLLIIGTDGLGNILGIDMREVTSYYVRMDASNLDWDEEEFRCRTLAELLSHVGDTKTNA